MSIPVDPYAEVRTRAEVDRATRHQVRCAGCGKLLAELVTAPWILRCPRCKAENRSPSE
jgi:rRNA maturation endonuclease Nob1